MIKEMQMRRHEHGAAITEDVMRHIMSDIETKYEKQVKFLSNGHYRARTELELHQKMQNKNYSRIETFYGRSEIVDRSEHREASA